MTKTTQDLPKDGSILVHAYLDNELDPAGSLAMAQQIDADPGLAAEVTRTEALQSALREKLPQESLSPHLRMRINQAVGLSRGSGHPTWRRLAASVVLAMALASGSTWLVLHPTSDNRIIDAVVDNHIRALVAPQPTDVASSERHTVKPWFNGRIPGSPHVVDLAPEGFPLIGARIDVIDTTLVPTLVYSRRKHVISLSQLHETSAAETWLGDRSVKGYNIVGWHQNQTSYWAISDLAADELKLFSQKFQASP
jgi:anti-sigma factor RsiW